MTLVKKSIKTSNGLKSISYDKDNQLSKEIRDLVESALAAIISSLGQQGFLEKTNIVKKYDLLESFIYANMAKPKYALNDYVKIRSFGIERIPNEYLNCVVRDVKIDYTRKKILYTTSYELENEYKMLVVNEKDIVDIQIVDPTFKNYIGRNELERFQYLKTVEYFENLED